MKTILVVDDEPHLRLLYRDILSDEGYAVVEAGDAETAVELLATQGADLAILDIRMPGTHGLELLARLHADHPQLPIIMSSGLKSLFDDYAIWEARDQIVGLLEKPVGADALVQCVQRALGARSVPHSP